MRLRYRVFLPVTVLACVQTAGLRAQANDPPEDCRGDEYRRYDYILGDWRNTEKAATASGELEVVETGESHIHEIVDGCAIVEHRTTYQGGEVQSRLLFLRAYDHERGRWNQVLATNFPAYIVWSVERLDAERTRFMTSRIIAGGTVHVRMTEEPTGTDAFRRTFESSRDGRRTWALDVVVDYTRIADAESATSAAGGRTDRASNGLHTRPRNAATEAPGSDAADEARRRRGISLVDVTGIAAVAKVELDYPGAFIADYFSLLKIDGEWKVMNKIFHVGTPRPDSEDARYFDFWPGTWVEVVDGRPDTSATTFTVRRSVHPAAFQERWKLVYDGAAHRSVALRAWDQVNQRWSFTWVNEDGLFQVWQGRKVGDDWYIVREFDIDGTRFLSRQAWLPQSANELIRTMERSFDGGDTWETRSRTRFRRVTG